MHECSRSLAAAGTATLIGLSMTAWSATLSAHQTHPVFSDNTQAALQAWQKDYKKVHDDYLSGNSPADAKEALLTPELKARFLAVYRRGVQVYDLQMRELQRFAVKNASDAPRCARQVAELAAQRPHFEERIGWFASTPVETPDEQRAASGALLGGVLGILTPVIRPFDIGGGCAIEKVGSRYVPRRTPLIDQGPAL